jgi:hypothetical protein
MVFFAYLDPPVLAAAAKGDAQATDAVVALLRGFVQNCVLVDFDDWRWETSIKRELSNPTGDQGLSLIKKLLVQLKKKERIVSYFQDDYSGASDMQHVLAQATSAELDLILTAQAVIPPAGVNCEVAKLENYQQSNFEETRCAVAGMGREYAGGELLESDFLTENLRKVVKFASRIEICDAIFGRKYADNYEYTLKALLRLMDNVLVERDQCLLRIHCEASNRNNHLLTQLAAHRPAKLPKLRIEVNFYEDQTKAGIQCLPHERYLFTNQVALEIGRGMDFLNKATGKNRDVSINLKDADTITRKISAFNGCALPVTVVP